MSLTEANSGSIAQAAVVPEFRLNFTIQGGESHGEGLYEWTSALTVRGGALPRASMLLNRHNGDLIGRPVGLFADVLPAAKAQQMVEKLDKLARTELPAPTKGDVRASMLRLEYQHGSLTRTLNFNAQNREYLNAIAPVMDDLDALMSKLLAKPERALAISIEKTTNVGDGVQFQLKLENVGVSDLVVADPRIMARGPKNFRAFVRVAPAPIRRPGEMEVPPRWKPLGLEPAAAGALDEGITIKPRESLTVQSAVWKAPASGEFIAQAVWQDYLGPEKRIPLTVVQPVLPKDAAPNAAPYLVRGATFSKYTRFTGTKR